MGANVRSARDDPHPFLRRKITTPNRTHEFVLGPSFGRTVITVAVCLTLTFLVIIGVVPAAAAIKTLMNLVLNCVN